MIRYVIRRLLIAIPLLLAITLCTFLFIHLAGGTYFDLLRLNPQMSPDVIALYESRYHLDRHPIIQYAYWLKQLLRGDLGYSFALQAPVASIIAGRLWNTLVLTVTSTLFTWTVALPMGIYAAVHHRRWLDRGFSCLAFVGMSIPNFFFALLLLWLASVTGWLPLGGMRSPDYAVFPWWGKALDVARHLAIPATVIATASLAGLQRITRGNMLEVLRAQYITTARAKGLPEHTVIYRHALRNAMNPLITLFGYQFSALLSGAALTEIICSWPGLGSLILAAVRQRDLFLVMGSMLMGGMLLLAGNLVADVLLAWTDPRIRYD